MDLRFSPEENAFRAEVRTFFQNEIPLPIRRKVIEGRELTKDDIVAAHKRLHAKGWAVPGWSTQWGGKDWTSVQFYIFCEEMQIAGVPPPVGFNVTMHGPVLIQFGTEKQKAHHLPRIAALDGVNRLLKSLERESMRNHRRGIELSRTKELRHLDPRVVHPSPDYPVHRDPFENDLGRKVHFQRLGRDAQHLNPSSQAHLLERLVDCRAHSAHLQHHVYPEPFGRPLHRRLHARWMNGVMRAHRRRQREP